MFVGNMFVRNILYSIPVSLHIITHDVLVILLETKFKYLVFTNTWKFNYNYNYHNDHKLGHDYYK